MAVPGISPCFRCLEPGHWADSCKLAIPATSKAEHEGRIRRFIDMWIDGRIETLRKRQLISEENEMWRTVNAPGRKAS